jgi:hypothetical protein
MHTDATIQGKTKSDRTLTVVHDFIPLSLQIAILTAPFIDCRMKGETGMAIKWRIVEHQAEHNL